MKKIKQFFIQHKRKMIIAAVLIISFSTSSYVWIKEKAKGHLFADTTAIPFHAVGLVLGTSPFTANGYRNPYFDTRIEAAAELFHAGKVKHLIVSGDNSVKEYNEPAAMLLALIKKGVPEEAISLDYAGFRTLDSVTRVKAIFGQNNVTLITQAFHGPRAVFLANAKGIEADVYLAKEPSLHQNSYTQWREYLARSKAVLDIVFGKKPKFLGKQITLPLEEN